MTVPVDLGTRPSLGKPAVLFHTTPNMFSSGGSTLVSGPDGPRFLFLKTDAPKPQAPITRLTVVHNWFVELERLCPTRR